ncbi:MAG: hypothetical protein EBR01_02250 [Proteobacteria bacterium]|nr:hypothetical protein [Pseudomonadota bacterium]NBY20086.1 hypothetical protein [bacterium]
MPEKHMPSANRIKETLGRLYENQPPHFREYMRRYQQDPTSRVFAPLAESYRRLGRLDEAIDICIEGLKHHPDFIGGRVALARCFIDKKRYVRAKEELEIVVGIAPDNLLAQRLLGDCFFSLKEMEQALRCYKLALVLSPSDVGLQDKVHRMEMQLHRGDFDEPQSGNESPASVSSSLTDSSLTVRSLGKQPENVGLAETFLDDVEALVPNEISDCTHPISESSVQVQSISEVSSVLMDGHSNQDEDIQLNETEEDELRRAKVDAILGFEEERGDSFKTEDVAKVFAEETSSVAEITTQTLGDLYLSQGQFEKALKIFDKIYRQRPSAELAHKIQSCRTHLGVDSQSLKRQQKIDALNAILKKNRNNR